MTTERYRTGAAIAFRSEQQINRANSPLTALGNVLLKIHRESDGFFFDFSDNTFKAAGHVDIDRTMTVVDAVNVPGIYETSWDTSLIVTPVANDKYFIDIQSATAVNLLALGEVLLGDFVDPVYQCKLGIIDDDASGTPTDRYTAAFFRDSEPIVTGLTAVTLQVIDAVDGTDQVPSTAMVAIGATGLFRLNVTLAARRMIDGEHYVALVSFTVDGAARIWRQWIGRDST